MIDVQSITQQVIDEVMSSMPSARSEEMEAHIVKTSADVTARILNEYQRKAQMGWPMH